MKLKTILFWNFFRSKRHRLSLLVGISLHLSRTTTGYAALQSYSTDFFRSVGLGTNKSQYLTISMSAISVFATIVTIPLMDRLGRRTLHLTGLGGIAFCFIIITVGLNIDNSLGTSLVVVFALLFMVFYVIGPGSIPWVATGELFTQGSRGAATSICIFINWSGGIIVSLLFPQLMNNAFNFSFLPFTICAVFFFIIGWIYFPETKDRPSRKIAQIFQQPNAWKTAIGFIKASFRRKSKPASSFKSDHNYGSIPENGNQTIQ